MRTDVAFCTPRKLDRCRAEENITSEAVFWRNPALSGGALIYV